MRILITNDDGINAPILPIFARWAQKLGEVTVVAPKFEQSGKSQALEFNHEVEIKRAEFPVDCEAWAMDSTPADCVRWATTGLGKRYDLVLSGINYGYNLGHDVVYSGTVGAIFEAARTGMKAIAFSTDFDTFDYALSELDRVYGFITEREMLSVAQVLNVNIPTQKCQGILVTRQGGRFFTDEFLPRGNDMFLQVGDPIFEQGDDLTIDVNAVRNGYISITPLTTARTDFAAYEALRTL